MNRKHWVFESNGKVSFFKKNKGFLHFDLSHLKNTFPNISVIDEASDLLPPKRKREAWLWARGAPKDLEVFFNIYTMADFKFDIQLGFAKADHKNHTQKKKWACISFKHI